MSTAQPFNFRDFSRCDGAETVIAVNAFIPNGTRGKKEEPAEPPPPPTFSEDELKAAERDAYQKGFLEGTKEGRIQAENTQAEVDRLLTDRTESFVAAITPLFLDYRALALDVRREMPRVALAIAQKMVTPVLSEEAIHIVEDVVLRCCEQMIGEPKLTITVHESLAPTLKHKLQNIVRLQPEPMQILVSPSADMQQSDCRIEWEHGSMERHTETLWNNVQRVIEDISFCAARDAEEQLSLLAGNLPIEAPMPIKNEPTLSESPEQKE